jgi:hypothetical protein
VESPGNRSATTLDLPPHPAGGRRVVWHVVAVALAAAVAWLVFAAYRQPDLILDLASMRLC